MYTTFCLARNGNIVSRGAHFFDVFKLAHKHQNKSSANLKTFIDWEEDSLNKLSLLDDDITSELPQSLNLDLAYGTGQSQQQIGLTLERQEGTVPEITFIGTASLLHNGNEEYASCHPPQIDDDYVYFDSVMDTEPDVITTNNLKETRLNSNERLLWPSNTKKVGVWQYDLQKRKGTWDDYVYEILGIDHQDFNADYASTIGLIIPEDRPHVLSSFERAMESGVVWQQEYRVRRPNGKVVWLYSMANVLRDEKGNARYVVGMICDNEETDDSHINILKTFEEADFAEALGDVAIINTHVPSGKRIATDNILEMVGMTKIERLDDAYLFRFVHPDDRKSLQEKYDSFFSGRSKGLTARFRYLHPDKGQRWFHLVSRSTSRDESGKPIWTVAVNRDLTEEKQLFHRLQRSETRNRFLIENIKSTLYTIDTDGTVVFVSNQIEALVGYTPNELLGKDFRTLVGKEDQEKVNQSLKTALNGQTGSAETAVFSKSKDVKWIHVTFTPLVEKGNVVCISGVLTDITQRKKRERDLARAEAMLRSIIDNIPVGLFWKNTQLIYEGCNGVFTKYAGIAHPSEIIGKTDYDLAWASFADRYRLDDREVIQTGEPKLNYEETMHIEIDNHRGCAKTSKIPIRNLQGEIVSLLGMFEDITPLKQAERKRETDRKRQALLAEVAMMFNRPTNSLKQIPLALEQMGRHIGANRVFIFEYLPDGYTMSVTHEWFDDEKQPIAHMFQNIPIDTITRIASVKDSEAVKKWFDPIDLPNEIGTIDLPDCTGVTLAVPMKMSGRTVGFVGFHDCATEHKWPPCDISFIWMLCETISNVIERECLHSELKRHDSAISDAYKRLKKQETLFRSIYEGSRDGIVFFTETGNILDCNESFARMFGYTLDEMKNLDPKMLTPDRRGIREGHDFNAEQVETSGFTDLLVVRCVRKDGSPFPVELTSYFISDLEEFSKLQWCVARDISTREEARRTLAESEALFRTIADYTEDWEYWILPNGNFKYVSKSAENITGFKSETFISNPNLYISIVHKDDREMFSEHLQESARETHELRYRIVTKHGAKRWLHHICRKMYDADGHFLGRRVSNRDISEQVRLEEMENLHREQLMLADKMVTLGVLVSEVAHEVNNPNNFIMLNAPLLKKAWQSVIPILDKFNEEQEEFRVAGVDYSTMGVDILRLCDGITNGSRRIQRIVSDLKNYARHDTNDLHALVNINDVVSSSISLMENMIKRSTRNFCLSLKKSPLMIRGNFQRLEQVIINLLQNACDALTCLNQKIHVETVDFDEDRVAINVQDNGRGMTKESIERMTTTFFTTKKEKGGMGLGLSVSQGIIKDHRGELRFQSEFGHGTIVTVLLPKNHGIKRRKV